MRSGNIVAVVAAISTTRSHSPTTDGIVASAGTIATNFDERWSAISAPRTETAESIRN